MYVVDVDMIKCRRCSSVVEHVIGNDGVVSPILISGTNKKRTLEKVPFFCWLSLAEADLRQDCDEQSESPEPRWRRDFVCRRRGVAGALAKGTILSAAPFLKTVP